MQPVTVSIQTHRIVITIGSGDNATMVIVLK